MTGVTSNREGEGEPTADEEGRESGSVIGGSGEARGALASTGFVVWALALATLAGGVVLVQRMDRTGVTAGVLLLVVSLACLAVALGGDEYGPQAEGRLDLSTRMAIGLLGGALGGLAHVAVAWAAGAVGIATLLGVSPSLDPEVYGWLTRVLHGTVWGLAFGLAYPVVPGQRPVGRGLFFSLLPAAYVLLKVLPLDAGAGLLGVELGLLTFAFVLLYHLAWGAVVGSVVGWAERTEFAPVSRPLGD